MMVACIAMITLKKNNNEETMSIIIDREKYTALLPLIQTSKGFVDAKVQPNGYTLKFSFDTGFACCISKNTKNTNLSVHFENENLDQAVYFSILSAIR